MSFDWLNVPGLNTNDTDSWTTPDPPPTVSFKFDEDAVDQSKESSNPGKGPVTSQGVGDLSPGLHKNDKRSVSDTQLTNYVESKDDLQVPLSLSRNQLSKEEVRTYLRWYGYIALRKHAKLIRLEDVFRFLSNFPLSDLARNRIEQIFKTCKNALNIGQFFAVLRLISRALVDGVLPTRKMLLEACPVPRPKPILTAGREEVYEEVEDTPADSEPKVDFDSFASLLLTGERKKRLRRRITNKFKRQKRVRFSDKLVTFQEERANDTDTEEANEETENEDDSGPLDLSLPMGQLLKKLAARKRKNSALVSKPPTQEPETQEEKEVLEDMKESLNHFQQIQNVDSVSLGGVPAQIPSVFVDSNGEDMKPLEPLKPTATGSANYLFRSSQEANSRQSQANSGLEPPHLELPLRPTATGSANHLARQHFAAPQALPLGNTLSVQPLLQSQSSGFAQSPQPTGHDTLTTGTTAGNYFQSLLSNSPSPNSSSLHIPQGNSRNAYNGYQMQLPQQRQMQPNPQQQQQQQQQYYPTYSGSTNMSYNNITPQYQSYTPSPVPQLSPPIQQNGTRGDILGDLRALKEQVDQLQNSYSR